MTHRESSFKLGCFYHITHFQPIDPNQRAAENAWTKMVAERKTVVAEEEKRKRVYAKKCRARKILGPI